MTEASPETPSEAEQRQCIIQTVTEVADTLSGLFSEIDHLRYAVWYLTSDSRPSDMDALLYCMSEDDAFPEELGARSLRVAVERAREADR